MHLRPAAFGDWNTEILAVEPSVKCLIKASLVSILSYGFEDLCIMAERFVFRTTVKTLYNGHFGTSHFWVIFAVIYMFSSFRGKNVLHGTIGTAKTCP